ncbi:MAG: D-glycerate dehydrogenase [Bryobacterales bacterium]|nr:D-glycerate dehydrogenase [Acidobacteriota bacterium]MCB9383862.1 D-glycerate dehydrogenase [Bryobacterales bacterium]
MRPSVLVTKHLYPQALDRIANALEVDYHDERTSMSPEALQARLQGKRGVICQLTDKITPALLDACPDLEVVSNVAVGYDNIDVAAATERGVVVTNTPGVLTHTTADLAFALILAAGRRLTESERFLRDGQWGEWYIDLLTGFDIHGATLGLLGMGRIGQAVARRARGFDMQVLYHNRSRLAEAEEAALGARYVSFDELLAESDFLSVHVPLSDKTRHIIDAAALRKMKPTAILVNTARGPVVDEAALAAALADGVIAYAGLDVFEKEPEVNAKLLEVPNVVLAPHIGSASVATRTRMCMMAAENCLAVLTGKRPANPVNPQVLGG